MRIATVADQPEGFRQPYRKDTVDPAEQVTLKLVGPGGLKRALKQSCERGAGREVEELGQGGSPVATPGGDGDEDIGDGIAKFSSSNGTGIGAVPSR